MSVAVYVAVEKAIADWLRTDATIASLCGGATGIRVYGDGLPPTQVKSPLFPYVELQRVGGMPDPGGIVPLDNPLLQVNVLGARKSSAEAVMAAVRSAFDGMTAGIVVGTVTVLTHTFNVVAQGARIMRLPRFLPPSSGDERPRYDADVLVSVIAVQTA